LGFKSENIGKFASIKMFAAFKVVLLLFEEFTNINDFKMMFSPENLESTL
jgi:hypothetical protein